MLACPREPLNDKEERECCRGCRSSSQFGAKVLSAEGTAVPLSDNAKQVPVAKRERMGKVAQIS
jgi:hypothetical protein